MAILCCSISKSPTFRSNSGLTVQNLYCLNSRNLYPNCWILESWPDQLPRIDWCFAHVHLASWDLEAPQMVMLYSSTALMHFLSTYGTVIADSSLIPTELVSCKHLDPLDICLASNDLPLANSASVYACSS